MDTHDEDRRGPPIPLILLVTVLSNIERIHQEIEHALQRNFELLLATGRATSGIAERVLRLENQTVLAHDRIGTEESRRNADIQALRRQLETVTTAVNSLLEDSANVLHEHSRRLEELEIGQLSSERFYTPEEALPVPPPTPQGRERLWTEHRGQSEDSIVSTTSQGSTESENSEISIQL